MRPPSAATLRARCKCLMSIFRCMLLPLPTPAAAETPLVYGLALISVLEGICSHEGIAILRARASAYPRAPTACATRSPAADGQRASTRPADAALAICTIY